MYLLMHVLMHLLMHVLMYVLTFAHRRARGRRDMSIAPCTHAGRK
jgi:hypothetical protein